MRNARPAPATGTGRTVGRDELFYKFLDGGVGGMVFGELGDVFGEFERDHALLPL